MASRLPSAPLWTRVVGVRTRAGTAVATSLGSWLPSAPLRSPDKGRWCPEASRNGRRQQSWGLGYHLPLSGQGSLVSGVEQERPSPAVLGCWLPSAPLWTRDVDVLEVVLLFTNVVLNRLRNSAFHLVVFHPSWSHFRSCCISSQVRWSQSLAARVGKCKLLREQLEQGSPFEGRGALDPCRQERARRQLDQVPTEQLQITELLL